MDNLFSNKDKGFDLSNIKEESLDDNESNNEEKTNNESPEQIQPKKINIDKYRDPEGLTVKKMAFGLWLLKNRKHFKFLTIVFFSIIIVFTWPKFLYTFGNYVLVDMKEDKLTLYDMIQTNLPSQEYFINKGAKSLQASNLQVFTTENNLTDFFTKVKNPNPEYISRFTYYFKTSNLEETQKFDGYILPGEEKYLIALGQDINKKTSNFEIIFENIKWERLNKHKYTDWLDFRDKHIQFEVSELVFTHAKESLLTEKYSLNELRFTITNNSSFNYWNTGFIILLRDNNNRIVAVNKQIITQFYSTEERQVDVTWPGKFGSIQKVEVIPDVDITNESNLMRFNSGVTNVK